MAENLSGVPPAVTLSGLNAGADGGNYSGAPAQGLSGTGGGAAPFGMEGGPDLAQLLAALQGQGDVSAAAGTPLTAGVGQGSFGQQVGGLGAGSFGQTQPGYIAGQSATGGQGSAQQAAQGSADPFAIIQKILGTAQKGLGGLGQAGTASPTAGGGGSDLTLNGPLFQPEGSAGNANVGVASPTIAQDMQGTLGSPFLNDPTINNLFTTGKLNGWDGSIESLNQLMASDPSIKDALFQGNISGSLGEQLGSGSGGAGGFTLGTGGEAAGPNNYLGAGMAGLGGATGVFNLLKALESGNAAGAVGGGLQGLGGLAGVLKNMPELSQALGLDPGTLGGIGAGVGGLGGLLSLYQGTQSGNPAQIASGVISALQALNALATGTQVGTSVLSASPILGAASGAISAAGPALGAAAPILMALAEYYGNSELMHALEAGYTNNPIKGGLYSAATSGVQSANQAISGLGDLGGADTNAIANSLTQALNAYMPYYATAQGGRGPVRASDTVTGKNQGPTSDSQAYTENGGVEAYTANAQRAQQGIEQMVNELLKRGVSYEQLGQLPVSQNWALNSLDANNPINALYGANAGKYDTEGQNLLNSALTRIAPEQVNMGEGNWWTRPEQLSIAGYGNIAPEDFTTQNLLQAAQGQGGAGGSNAQQLITGMYGGPLWTALARTLSPTWQNPEGPAAGSLQSLIQQHFDPWAVMRGQWGANPSSVGTSLMPILQGLAAQRTGGGGGMGDVTSGTD